MIVPRVEAECKKRLKELAAVANEVTAREVGEFLEYSDEGDPEDTYLLECSRDDLTTSLRDMLAEAGYNLWLTQVEDIEIEHPNAPVVNAVWCGYDRETGDPQFDLKFYAVAPKTEGEGKWELKRRERGTAAASLKGVWALRKDGSWPSTTRW